MLLQFFSSTSSRRLSENNILLTAEGFGYTLNFLWYNTWPYYAESPTPKRTCEKGVRVENVPDWDEKFPNNKNYTITEIEVALTISVVTNPWTGNHLWASGNVVLGCGGWSKPRVITFYLASTSIFLNDFIHVYISSIILFVCAVCLFIFYTCS